MTTSVGHTYYPVVCGSRIEPYQAGGAQGDCADYGLQMAIFDSAAARTKAETKFHDASLPAHSVYFPPAGSTTDNYLCSTNDASAADLSSSPTDDHWKKQSNLIGHDAITRAEAGKYIIFYHVSDNAGNSECITKVRTVTVR